MKYISLGKMRTLVLVATPLLCAGTSWASGSGNKGDTWTNAAWALGLFAILLVILTRFGFKPVLKAMNDREQALRDMNDETARRKAESAELLDEYRQRLKKAEQEAAQMLEESRKQAEMTREEILQHAREQAAVAIEEAERRIDIAGRKAMDELYGNAADLAGEIASRLIGRELTDTDQARIIAERIKNLENLEDGHPGTETDSK